MDYISVKEAAEKFELSARRVQNRGVQHGKRSLANPF